MNISQIYILGSIIVLAVVTLLVIAIGKREKKNALTQIRQRTRRGQEPG